MERRNDNSIEVPIAMAAVGVEHLSQVVHSRAVSDLNV